MPLPIESLYDRESFEKICFLATDDQLRAIYARELSNKDDGTEIGLLNLLCAAIAEIEMVRRGLKVYPLQN